MILQKIKDKFLKQQKPIETKTTTETNIETIPEPKYSFVEQYTLLNPNTVMVDYNSWGLCDYTPVATEQGFDKNSGFSTAVNLRTAVILPFINALKQSKPEDIKPVKMRTISIVHLSKDEHIYILPVLPIKNRDEKCWLYFVNDNSKTIDFKPGWSLKMTPEINRAIADQMKIYRR